MAEQSLNEFEAFLDRVIGASKLEIAGGKIAKAFFDEFKRDDAQLEKYKNKISPHWETWKVERGNFLLSPFIADTPEIFKDWLSMIFPFADRRIDVHIVKGGSNVDCNGHIFYSYVREERELLKKICEKYQVVMDEREAIRMILTNSIKSLDSVISQIIETNYRLYIDKIDFFEHPGSFYLKIDFVGRIG